MTMDIKKINWKQPKYLLPAIIYFPLLFVGYFVIDLFHTEKAEIPDESLHTTEYLNPKLPEAQMRGDGIGNKYESMLKSYGRIDDYSAMENIERNEDDTKEAYDSKYSDEELQQLESSESERLAELQRQLQASAEKGERIGEGQGLSEEERIARSHQREQEAIDELNRALAMARLQGQQATQQSVPQEVTEPVETKDNPAKTEGSVSVNERSVKALSEEDEAQEAVKKVKVTSDYFNTLRENDPEPNLIKAIVDEDVKAVDGSRVRLRLLDVEILVRVLDVGERIRHFAEVHDLLRRLKRRRGKHHLLALRHRHEYRRKPRAEDYRGKKDFKQRESTAHGVNPHPTPPLPRQNTAICFFPAEISAAVFVPAERSLYQVFCSSAVASRPRMFR